MLILLVGYTGAIEEGKHALKGDTCEQKKYRSTCCPGRNYQAGLGQLVPRGRRGFGPTRAPRPQAQGRWGWREARAIATGLTGSPAARCCSAPSCPGAAQTRAWWPGHWARGPGRGSDSAGWSASSCWGSWRTSGDATACGCAGVAEGASESTGCGGLEDLEKKAEKWPSGAAGRRRELSTWSQSLDIDKCWTSPTGNAGETTSSIPGSVTKKQYALICL